MKNYLAIFLGTPASPKFAEFMAMEEGKRKKIEAAGMKAWGDWMQKHQSVIVETGGPLGKTKRTSAQGVSDTKNNFHDLPRRGGKVVRETPAFHDFPRRLGGDHGNPANSGATAGLTPSGVRKSPGRA